MIRICRRVELLLMTADAGHRRAGVDPVNVAGSTGCRHVRSGQQEFRSVVIEG